MKKILIFLCLLLTLSLCSCATDYSKTYYPNGQVASENNIRQPYWPGAYGYGYGYGGYGCGRPTYYTYYGPKSPPLPRWGWWR